MAPLITITITMEHIIITTMELIITTTEPTITITMEPIKPTLMAKERRRSNKMR